MKWLSFTLSPSGGKPIRKSRIPVGIKSPSPPKPMAIKKNSLIKKIRQRNATDVSESYSSASSVTSNANQSEDAYSESSGMVPVTLPEYCASEARPTQQSVHDSADVRNEIVGKSDFEKRSDAVTEMKGAGVSASSLPCDSTDSRKRDVTDLETEQSWNKILQGTGTVVLVVGGQIY